MQMNYINEIADYIALVKSVLDTLDKHVIAEALKVLLDAYEQHKTVYIFGNGGSASTASHFQNDFNKGISEYTSKKFCVVCLSDNVATLTAIANDNSFDEIYRQQLAGRVTVSDVVIAISGSGNSDNVINGVLCAKETGATVIGMSGYTGGRLAKICDIHINVKVNSMQITEDVYLILNHLMMSILCRQLSGKEHLSDG